MMNLPDAPPGDALTPPGADGGGASLVTVPMNMLPGCKVGDTYKVASVDQGEVQMEHMPGPGDESGDIDQYAADAKSAVPME